MADLVDSYSETNADSGYSISDANDAECAQSFTVSATKTLDSVKFYLRIALGSPSGNMFAKIYNLANAIGGGDDKPSGSALATSDAVAASTVTGSFALITFPFSGANRIALNSGSDYAVAVSYTAGGGSNYIEVACDASSPGHIGNQARLQAGVWTAVDVDNCFYVYGVDAGGFPANAIWLINA